MSGSIGANRIPTKAVKPTVDNYIEKVLKGFPGYKSCDTTGSYNVIMQLGQEKKEGHGDIDLAVHIEAPDLKKLKKDFKSYCEKLPDDVTVPFKDGKRKGDKAQLFGAIVTIGFPIAGDEDKYVQIDNILVTTEKDKRFQKSFLDMNAQKQALFQGLVRVLLQHENKETIWKHFGFKGLPEPNNNQEYEFVLSTAGLSLRLITLTDDRKEDTKKRVELWRSNDWDDVEWLMRDYKFNGEYEEQLDIVAKRITDERSRSRIVGIIKSMIHVGPGEVGTPKGEAKEAGIKLAAEKLGVKLEGLIVSLKDYVEISEAHLIKKHQKVSDNTPIDKKIMFMMTAAVSEFSSAGHETSYKFGYTGLEITNKEGESKTVKYQTNEFNKALDDLDLDNTFYIRFVKNAFNKHKEDIINIFSKYTSDYGNMNEEFEEITWDSLDDFKVFINEVYLLLWNNYGPHKIPVRIVKK